MHVINKNKILETIYLCVLLFLAIFVMFYRLGSNKLWAWDEALHAEVARETFEEGSGWLNTHYNYQPWFQKPPLFIWLITFSYILFGVSEFSVRFFSAFFGVGTVLLLYLFARSVFSRYVAIFASLILLGLESFVELNRMGMTDTALTFFILLGLYIFWLGIRKEKYLIWFGIIVGIGFLIKGIAIFQILLIVVLFSLVSGHTKMLFKRPLVVGLVIGAAMVVSWHLYHYLAHPESFIRYYFIYNIADRITTQLDKYSTDFLYYFKIIIFRNEPWGALSLYALMCLIAFPLLEKEKTKKEAIQFILCAALGILGIFSLVKTKRFWYILPLLPFLALTLAYCLEKITSLTKFLKIPLRLFTTIILIVMVIFVSSKYANLTYDEELKTISLNAYSYINKSHTIQLYRIYEHPVVLFYSERKIKEIDYEGVANISHWESDFCLIFKDASIWNLLKGKIPHEVRVLQETRKYALLKRVTTSVRPTN